VAAIKTGTSTAITRPAIMALPQQNATNASLACATQGLGAEEVTA